MDEIFTVEMVNDRMNVQMGALHEAISSTGGGDASRMIENESRSFFRRVIAQTPPLSKAQGESAIERDLNKIFTPVNEGFLNDIGSQFGVSGIDTWITNSGGAKDHLQWDRLDPSGAGMQAFHRANLTSRGRTRKLKRKGQSWYAPYVVTVADFADYLTKIQARLGKRKAAWAISLYSVGGKVASWIERHLADAKGECFNDLKNQYQPSITAINRSVGIEGDRRMVREQMEFTAKSIAKKARLILAGYAYDMANGRVISPKEMREAA